MGDAQASADEANGNFDMLSFYEEFLNKIRDDQLRYDGNHVNDTGALADVVPFDGIGGNPGCPVWQVAYIVIARQVGHHTFVYIYETGLMTPHALRPCVGDEPVRC